MRDRGRVGTISSFGKIYDRSVSMVFMELSSVRATEALAVFLSCGTDARV